MFRVFDPRGRGSAGEFITVSLTCLIVATPLMVIIDVKRGSPLAAPSLVGLWLVLGVMWIAAIRRVHDSDWTAPQATWMAGGPTILLFGITSLWFGVALPFWLVVLGAAVGALLISVGVLSSVTAGKSARPNRFGPDPARRETRVRRGSDDTTTLPAAPAAAWPIVDPRGRTSRSGFAAAFVLCLVFATPLVAITHSADRAGPIGIGLGVVGFVLAAALLLVASVRRSHDLNGGAGFGLLVGIGPLLCTPVLFIESLAVAPALYVGGLLTLGLLLMATGESVRGPTRYGPDPLKRLPPKRRAAHGEEFLKIRRRMKRLALPTLLFTDTDGPGFSKLGGDPELPGGLAWPSRERGPLSFLAQVDLAQAHERGGPDWLPQTGGLYLFAEADGGGGDGRAAVVLHAPEVSAIEPTPPPPGLPKFGARFGERRVALASFTSLPSLDALGIDVQEIDVEEDELDELSDLPTQAFKADRLHRLAGYPNEIQESRMALECELGSRGLDTGGSFERDADPKLLRAAKSWRLLLQVDSDPELGMMWGDTGMLYVFVREADARAGDFSKTWLISQSH